MISCPSCGKLYSPRDLGLSPGSEFQCACGAVLRTPDTDAAPPAEGVKERLTERLFNGAVTGALGWWLAWAGFLRISALTREANVAAGVLIGFAVGALFGPAILNSVLDSLSTRPRRPDD
jgi:hypothetical protein